MENLTQTHTLIKSKKGKPSAMVSRPDLKGGVESHHGVTDPDLLSVKFNALGNEQLDRVNLIHAQLDKAWKSEAQPFDKRGYWIIANHRLQTFQDLHNDAQQQGKAAMEEYLESYPDHVESHRQRMGTAFDPSNYPTIEELRKKHYIEYDIAAVPDPELDQRAGWTQEMKDRFAKTVKEQNDRCIATAVKDMQERLTPLVSRIAQIKDYDGGRTGSFNDSIIDNLREFIELMPDFNLSGDAEIENVRKELIEKLANVNPQTLRVDDKIRMKTVDEAEALLAKIGNFGVKK